MRLSNKENISLKLKDVYQEALRDGISQSDLHQVYKKSVAGKLLPASRSIWNCENVVVFYLSAIMTCILISIYYDGVDPRCIVGTNSLTQELSRPTFQCDMCKDIDQVPTIDGNLLTKDLFLSKYAYTGVPLLVKNGAKNWSALHTFSFDYLKNLYQLTDGALEAVAENCQFFPYKTSFSSLTEVFEMPKEQSKLEPGQPEWYVGWSNCDPTVAKELRSHYTAPTFLPDDSESSNLDWLFMGGFGGGANIHIDSVQRPSWQAMIAGKKSWKIIPSPECDSVCKTLNATMEKGDIILVDTNMWYHSTYIHPGEMSITIGSEYD
ncbi:hypothetical protein EB796_000270 [Bugula neritina]|uniref:JMJD6 n=1 Tax=Bugula neritina TaxID=10212 RepID=A0A7J7KTI1_BUGNE|nr:hypothetical protein EB796_000270 [Bugula neritina]